MSIGDKPVISAQQAQQAAAYATANGQAPRQEAAQGRDERHRRRTTPRKNMGPARAWGPLGLRPAQSSQSASRSGRCGGAHRGRDSSGRHLRWRSLLGQPDGNGEVRDRREMTAAEANALMANGPSLAPAYAEEPGRDYRKERDAAASNATGQWRRWRGCCLPARFRRGRGGTAWLAEHDPNDAEWDPEWRTIVFIDGPTGQLSWHLHDSDVPLFDGLPRGPNSWDGHTTPEKYERVARLGR